jgi:hypothetical protein
MVATGRARDLDGLAYLFAGVFLVRYALGEGPVFHRII